MPHLEPERLAAFDHERWSVDEQAHLATCADCRREVAAMTALVAHAAALRTAPERAAPPLSDSFDRVRIAQREAARTVDAAPSPGRPQPRALRTAAWPWTMRRVAASVALVAGGALLGRLTAPSRAPSSATTTVEPPLTTVTATALLDRAQRDYERAALWLVANDSTPDASDAYRARLAALDDMMAASRAGLHEAPEDPLLNHYLLSAWSVREATLQQLGAVLPVDKVIERY